MSEKMPVQPQRRKQGEGTFGAGYLGKPVSLSWFPFHCWRILPQILVQSQNSSKKNSIINWIFAMSQELYVQWTSHSALTGLTMIFKSIYSVRRCQKFPISATFLSPAGKDVYWRGIRLNKSMRVIFWDVNRWKLLFLIIPTIPYGRRIRFLRG